MHHLTSGLSSLVSEALGTLSLSQRSLLPVVGRIDFIQVMTRVGWPARLSPHILALC